MGICQCFHPFFSSKYEYCLEKEIDRGSGEGHGPETGAREHGPAREAPPSAPVHETGGALGHVTGANGETIGGAAAAAV